MPIPLALIASSSSSSHEILISSTDPGAERFQTAAATILTRIDSRLNSRLSYAFEDWLFHYVSEEGFIFMCVADGEGGRRLPFALLSEVQKQVSDQWDILDLIINKRELILTYSTLASTPAPLPIRRRHPRISNPNHPLSLPPNSRFPPSPLLPISSIRSSQNGPSRIRCCKRHHDSKYRGNLT